MAGTRREVLRLYKSILRLGQRWEAADPIETRVEREYIVDEARYTFLKDIRFFKNEQKRQFYTLCNNKILSRTLFRRNAMVKGEDLVRERMKEAETRLTMATHYGNPYPR